MFRNHLKLAWRSLVRNKTITLLNVLGLATGVAACLFIGLWIERELSYDNFHSNADRIYRIVNTFKSESESFTQAPSGPGIGAQIPAVVPEIEASIRYFQNSDRLRVNGEYYYEPELIIADTNFFSFFNFPLLKGQPIQVFQNMHSIVLTESLATKYFGDQNPIGQIITLDNQVDFTVTGIAADPPVNSHIEFSSVVPMTFFKSFMKEQYDGFDIDNQLLGGWMATYFRVNEGTTLATLERKVNEAVREKNGKQQDSLKISYAYLAQPLRDIHLKSNLRYDTNNGSMSRVYIFAAIGLVVLFLACINYMNLATAGSLKRAKETGIRKVTGALPRQLVGQFLTESILTTTIAVAAGTAFFQLLLPSFERFTGQGYEFGLSFNTVSILAGAALGLGLLAGLYPAFVLSSFQPIKVLRGSFQRSVQGGGMRRLLVVVQFTATVVLLIGIFVIHQQMRYIQSRPLGFEQEAVIQVNFGGANEVNQQFESLRNELLKSPTVVNVSQHNGNVIGGLGNGWTSTVDKEGKEISTSLYRASVDEHYLETYHMQLAAGRFFSAENPSDVEKSVLVNESAVRTFGWESGEAALGKPFGKGDNAKTVIGVVEDFHFESLHKPVEPLVLHYTNDGGSFSIRTANGQAQEAITYLEDIWQQRVPEVPLRYEFVDEELANQYGNEKAMQRLFLLFAGISLLIACLGLFGLTLFMVEQRSKEIGIRKVLGASVEGLVLLLSKDFMKLITIALVLASPIAWYLMREWLQNFAYHIDIPIWVFGMAGLLAIGIAFLTVSVQSVKAALDNPIESLRQE